MSGWREADLLHVWRALKPQADADAWSYIHLTGSATTSVEVGCHFPDAREALIVSFPPKTAIHLDKLPKGNGFDVARVELCVGAPAIALVRRPEGALDLFATMVVDTLHTVENTIVNTPNADVAEVFLSRVKEWQSFMSRAHRPLSPEAQIGLFGELYVLRVLTETSLGVKSLGCWQGPLHAAQDFFVHGGAIEVKSSGKNSRFMAEINSIEQLDSDRYPLFLTALSFEEAPDGESLPELVAGLRKRFLNADAQRSFDALLLIMGYLDEHIPVYGQRRALKKARSFRVEDTFPRLSRAGLPEEIRTARYTLDIDALETPFVGISEMIKQFEWN